VGHGNPPRSSAADLRRLVTRAKAGDEDAVDALYRQHVDRIYAYLAANVGNPHDAEDLTTQTFVRMLVSLPRYRPGSTPFAAWLSSAEDEALLVLDREVMRGELATLPLGQREVLTLKFLCGLTNAEVAAVLRKTEGAVKALERRALRTLQRRPIRAA
jgi:RNA polymerase sigma-70 factor, ECF subfamily